LHSAGPVIERETLFCDLSRYFEGGVDISSVAAHSLEWHEDAGKLSELATDENRIHRVTSAPWCVNRSFFLRRILLISFHRKYENGVIGTFTHCVALKGHDSHLQIRWVKGEDQLTTGGVTVW